MPVFCMRVPVSASWLSVQLFDDALWEVAADGLNNPTNHVKRIGKNSWILVSSCSVVFVVGIWGINHCLSAFPFLCITLSLKQMNKYLKNCKVYMFLERTSSAVSNFMRFKCKSKDSCVTNLQRIECASRVLPFQMDCFPILGKSCSQI